MTPSPATLLRLSLGAGALLALAAPLPALAQKNEELPLIRISDPNRDLFKLALPNVNGASDLAGQAAEIQRKNLEIVGLFRVLDPASFPPDLQREGMSFSSALWSTVGAQGVSKVSVARAGGGIKLQGQLYQVGRGERPVLEKSYSGAELRPLVHQWANDVIEQFTGTKGIFGSRIAFATTGRGREIATVGADGADMKAVTAMRAESRLPAFSPSGDQIAFTSYMRGTPDLYVVSSAGGRARVLSKRPGMNIGAVYLPDGRNIVLTMSYQGNAELYRVSASDGREAARLTQSSSIDMSATVSPDGGEIAFASDRQGSMQIFTMPAGGGAAKRITFQGGNNTTPRWNPNKNKPLIAFTGRDERGVFDIFVYDRRTGKIDRMTQGKGSNQDPAWSPDGRLLVYASNRGGLFVMNPETGIETPLWKGGAESPHWGPVPK